MFRSRRWGTAAGCGAALLGFAGGAWAQAQDGGYLPPCGPNIGLRISSFAIHRPETGEAAEAEVGQSMVVAAEGSVNEGGLSLAADYVLRGHYAFNDFILTIPAGPMAKTDPVSSQPISYTYSSGGSSKPLPAWARPKLKIVEQSANPLTLVAKLDGADSFPLDAAAFTVAKCTAAGGDGFRRELVYTGVAKGVITLQYREFQNNMARSAFSQEVHYDLAEGDEIGFRGARLKILKATNASVKYVVLKPLE